MPPATAPRGAPATVPRAPFGRARPAAASEPLVDRVRRSNGVERPAVTTSARREPRNRGFRWSANPCSLPPNLAVSAAERSKGKCHRRNGRRIDRPGHGCRETSAQRSGGSGSTGVGKPRGAGQGRRPWSLRNGSPIICTTRSIGGRSAIGSRVAIGIGIEREDAKWHSAQTCDQEKLDVYRAAIASLAYRPWIRHLSASKVQRTSCLLHGHAGHRMGIDHRRLHAAVAQKLLDSANIVVCLQ